MLLGRAGRPGQLALLALPALGGCGLVDGDASACDADDAARLGLVFADETGAVHDVTDGVAVPLISAPQGGHIVLVAPRLRAGAECEFQVNAALRDPASSRVLGLEERPIVLRPRGDGWAAPEAPAELSDLANVAVCPSVVTDAIDGVPFRLEVRLLDASGAPRAGASATVRPTCSSDYCRADCSSQGR